MTSEILLPLLSLATIFIVLGLAIWSKKRTEAERHDPDHEKSSLAKDGPGPQPIRPSGE